MKHKEIVALMGKLVVVSAKLKKTKIYTGGGKVVHKQHDIKERVGWVTGFRYLLQGKVDYAEFIEDGDRIPCLLVVFWPTMNPVRVPMDAWREVREDEVPAPTQYPWTDHDRAVLREEMADVPRDVKGRWRSTTCKKD